MSADAKSPGLMTLLFDPVTFIQSRVDRPPALGGAMAVFLAFLIPYMIALISLANKVVTALPDYLEPDMIKSLVFFFTLSVISQGIAGIIMWIVGTGMLTCLSIIFDGDADYRKLLEFTGYAFLPCAIGAIAMAGYVLPTDLDLAFTIDKNMSEAVVKREMLDTIHNSLSTLGFKIVGACNQIATLWTVVLMVLGLKYAGKLTYGKSVLSLVLMGAFFLLVLYLRRVVNPWGM